MRFFQRPLHTTLQSRHTVFSSSKLEPARPFARHNRREPAAAASVSRAVRSHTFPGPGEKHTIIFPGRPRSVWEVPFGLLAESLISEQRGWKLVRALLNIRAPAFVLLL